MSKQNAIPNELLVAYEKLVQTIPDLERKGVSMPYTSINGNMFSFLGSSGSLALRLPVEEREQFINKFKTDLYIAHGAVMKEYVTVPKKLQLDVKALAPYFKKSYEYTKALKTKPTTKKKK